MKFRFYHLIIILIGFCIGYVISPTLFPYELKKAIADTQVDLPPLPPPTPLVQDETPADDTPEPDDTPIADNETPEDDIKDSEEEEDETDLEGTDVKRMTRITREDNGRRPVNEEKFTGKLSPTNWRHPKQVQMRLANALRARLGANPKPEKVMQVISNPENRLMIAQWDMLSRADIDSLTKLMNDRKVSESLAPLLNDLPWVSSFVYDGELTKPEIALGMIYHFRQTDPNMDKDALDDMTAVERGVKRRIAAAVAVEFTRKQWYGDGRELTENEIKELKDIGSPVSNNRRRNKDAAKKDTYRSARERYLLFANGWDEGLLNSKFGKLPGWLMHFVCGWKSDMNSPFGSATSLAWQRDNVSARPANYTGMAYQVSYLPLNAFGDTIFSAWYYEPFSVLDPGKHAKVVRDTGGVCGSLSHFGASSAVANGVPAFTMGEPGHCAYAVYHKGKWQPCNSISEKRSPHWSCWGLYSWSAMSMYTDMYEDGARTRDAQLICSLADMLAATRRPNDALKLYEMSVTMQPLYHPVWEHYLTTAAKSLKNKPSKFLGVNEFVCSSVAPKHPEMCSRYLTEIIYPTLLKALRNNKQKLIAFGNYFENLNENEKAEWDMEVMLEQQYEALGKQQHSAKENYFRMIAEAVQKHPDFGIALSWAVRKAFSENKSMGEKVRGMVDKMLADMPKIGEDPQADATRRLLNASVVRAAEEMCKSSISSNARMNSREKDHYISLINQYSKDYMTPDADAKAMPKFAPPPGNIISAGGVVMLDKYNPKQENIVKHAAALTPEGGHILSEKGKHVKLIIELPRRTYIGGLVIVPTSGTCAQYREWFVETSADGKTWQLLQNLPDSSDRPCVILDIKKCPNAKFIRIDSGAEQNQGIDFKAILVYDNKKAK
ncbi:MAG: hypothetical protein J1E42_08165 [Akkermansiaceae bacterium]|nr:hypothetical protein [Akkermansiaceae bacterium]